MRHIPWLESQAIFAVHGGVVMLSKIGSTRHFGFFNTLASVHHSVWLNKVSRIVEKKDPKSWTAVEQLPLDSCDTLRFMRHVAKN